MSRKIANDQAADWVSVEKLVPWAQNPRKNEAAVSEVAASIRRFGFGAPILARREDAMVIAGHTRLKAAVSIGMSEVPVRWMDLDATEAKLLALADNKVGEIAEWDEDKLRDVLRSLQVQDNLEGLGFSSDDVSRLIDEQPEDAEVKEWTASDLSPREQIVVVLNARHADKQRVLDMLRGSEVHRAFLTYDGAVQW